MLQEIGLIDIRTEGGERCLQFAQLPDVERYSRMYYDLSINITYNLINVRECLHDNKSSGTNYTDFMVFINRNNEIRIIYA